MRILLLLISLLSLCQGQCPGDIPESDRRDCYPWPGAFSELCSARGCVWCETSTPDIPFCYHDDTVCPSVMAEADRMDCLPEGGFKPDCNNKGCVWCETETPGIPFCFSDPGSSQGGSFCPADIRESERVDCHPEADASLEECVRRGCNWCQAEDVAAPWCFLPKQRGYRAVGAPEDTPRGFRQLLERINTNSLYGAEIHSVYLDVEFQTENQLRLKFSDATASRWEVPVPIATASEPPETTQYSVEISSYPVFSLKVVRISTGATLIDTSIGGLTLSDQFLQFSTYLNTGKVYGFGEHEHHTFMHSTNWTTWGMWTRDQAVTTSNLYGQQPFYINLEQTNEAHGVLFLNSNAQDVKLMPDPALTFRTIGGVLDIYIFLGPTPEQVVNQYLQAVGYPVMPPYWSLGFQLCRWGYQDLDHMKAAVDRMRQYDIPHDIQYGDIDYMDAAKDFTIDEVNFAGLPEYVQELKQQGTKFIIILDPGIYNQDPEGVYPSFDRGMAADVWVKDSDNVTDFPGEVWPGPVFYPDFSKQSCIDWWVEECVIFKQQLDYEGLWIDMNEPSSFIHGRPPPADGCVSTPWNEPPYLPAIADRLWEKTMCMEAKQVLGDFYNVHSLYGWSMSEASFRAARVATGHRSITYSRSTFPGTGQWAQHWLGDNWSEWSNLRWSIHGLFEFNMFGMPYVGADICGFIGTTTEEMCARWQQLGAFYTFSRNHNADGNPDQDPGMWSSVGETSATTLRIRYTLLPFLYTLFHHAHIRGETVIRPLMFEFTQDQGTHTIGDQFIWGSAFLVTPVLDEGATSVNAYFPDAPWYSYYDGKLVSVRGGYTELDAPLDFINLHVRGGYVLPTQQPANSTVFSRLNPMGLLVALSDEGTATGDLFWDDGESIDTQESGNYFFSTYTVEEGMLYNNISHLGYEPDLAFETVTVFGTPPVAGVVVNGDTWEAWSHDTDTLVLLIQELDLSVSEEFSIEWIYN